MDRERLIDVAQGSIPADTVVKGVQLLDVFSGRFVTADVAISQGFIAGIVDEYRGKNIIDGQGKYLVPGFIDAHVHIESSMLVPKLYAQCVLPHGTTAVIWDPHEITNVKGIAGIEWALRSSEDCLLDIFVMIPSCVPSTPPALGLETSGACLMAADIERFRDHPRVIGLAEMMNYPGVIDKDKDVLNKLDLYRHKNLDGHCPTVRGYHLNAYAAAGIRTCHESVTRAEAQEKMTKGVHVLIREGSCAKNAGELLPLLNDYTSAVTGFCTDDRNPHDVSREGHISAIINQALRSGIAAEVIFRAASFSTAQLYGLRERGAIAPGYRADFCLIVPDDCDWKNGFVIDTVFKNGVDIDTALSTSIGASTPSLQINPQDDASFRGHNISLSRVKAAKFHLPVKGDSVVVRVVGLQPGQIITDHLTATLTAHNGELLSDTENDVLKIAVIERYSGKGGHSTGFVRGFNLQRGAIAASVAHDSHNIIVVGCDDVSMGLAVNLIIKCDGGIAASDGQGQEDIIELPVGGLMSNSSPGFISEKIGEMKRLVRGWGCSLDEPFLQLSFLALPVIPALKITDKGLVDVTKFRKIPLVVT